MRPIQDRIDTLCRQAFSEHKAKTVIVVGILTPDTQPSGRLLFAGRDAAVNPFGDRLVLDARTPFTIGSISKVFTSGIHQGGVWPSDMMGSWRSLFDYMAHFAPPSTNTTGVSGNSVADSTPHARPSFMPI